MVYSSYIFIQTLFGALAGQLCTDVEQNKRTMRKAGQCAALSTIRIGNAIFKGKGNAVYNLGAKIKPGPTPYCPKS